MTSEEENQVPLNGVNDDSVYSQTPDQVTEDSNTADYNNVEEVPTNAPIEEMNAETGTSLAFELPPEAQGEAHGGPLGCCLGLVVGVFLTALLMTIASVALGNGGFLGVATVPVLAVGTILCGYFGWKIGKKLYREYDTSVVNDEQQSSRHRARHA